MIPTGPRQGRRPPSQTNEVATSPTLPTGAARNNLPSNACLALHDNGADCQTRLKNPEHSYCHKHYKEYMGLYENYKKIEARYDALENGPEKISAGKEDVQLRETVNQRFFSYPGADNRSHVKRILRVRQEIHTMQDEEDKRKKKVLEEMQQGTQSQNQNQNQNQSQTPQQNASGAAQGSLQKPTGQPRAIAGSTQSTKKTQTATSTRSRNNTSLATLFTYHRGLYDVSDTIRDEIDQQWLRPLNVREMVTRCMFRILVALVASEETWERAKAATKFHQFLQESTAAEVDVYLTALESLTKVGGEKNVFLLRDAICDFCTKPEEKGVSVVHLLGGTILASDRRPTLATYSTTGRHMTMRGWDLLKMHYEHIAQFDKLILLAPRFEDFLAVKTMTVLERFGRKVDLDGLRKSTKDKYDFEWKLSYIKRETWYIPSDDLSTFCPPLLLHGFVLLTRSTHHGIQRVVSTVTEERQYLTGRMSKNDPATLRLAHELARRSDLITLVFDPINPIGNKDTRALRPPFPIDNVWIVRKAQNSSTRSTDTLTVVKNMRDLVEETEQKTWPGLTIARDYYEFTIVHKISGTKVNLVNVVFDALVKLKRYPTHESMFGLAVSKYLPLNDWPQYWESITTISRELESTFPSKPQEPTKLVHEPETKTWRETFWSWWSGGGSM